MIFRIIVSKVSINKGSERYTSRMTGSVNIFPSSDTGLGTDSVTGLVTTIS